MGCQNCVSYIKGEKDNEITKNEQNPEIKPNDDKIPKAKRGVPFGMHRFEDEGDGYHYVEETYNYNNYNDFNNAKFDNFDKFDKFDNFNKVVQQNDNIPSNIFSEILDLINIKRQKHSVPPLKLNKQINSIAQKFAKKLAQMDILDFSNNEFNGEPLGETLFSFNGKLTAEKIVNSWYDEGKNYNYKRPDQTNGGNFTQLVWKSSKEFGFGIAKSGSGMYYAVGNFYPAGNYVGEHDKNVLPPKGGQANDSNAQPSTSLFDYVREEQSQPKKNTFQIMDNDEGFARFEPADKYEYQDPKKKNIYQQEDNDDYYQPNLNQYNEEDDPAVQGGQGGDDEINNEALAVHNQLRARHHAPPLKLNKELCQIAKKYAQYLADNELFEHSKGKYHGDNMGENLYMCGGFKLTGKKMTEEWYSEIKDYDFSGGSSPGVTGHFTQVVWKGSKEVGFGVAKSRGGNYYGVGNYYPAGNWVGEYEENVLPA